MCQALLSAGILGFFMGRYDESKQYLEESLAIAREIGHNSMIANVLSKLGDVSVGQGDRAAARRHFEESIALLRELGDRFGLRYALNGLADLHRTHGDFELAELLYEENLALDRGRGDSDDIAICLFNLAMVSIGRGSSDRAREKLIEALAITEQYGYVFMAWPLFDISGTGGVSRRVGALGEVPWNGARANGKGGTTPRSRG